jgi:hypothetical protein
LVALGIERKVYHHDGVLFDDPDQQNDSYESNDAQVVVEPHQHKERADARGRQR